MGAGVRGASTRDRGLGKDDPRYVPREKGEVLHHDRLDQEQRAHGFLMRGKRVHPEPDQPRLLLLQEGEYGQINGIWYCRPPGNHMGSLERHEVVEHEDGTITVKPSILIDDGRNKWHGFLVKGEWQEA